MFKYLILLISFSVISCTPKEEAPKVETKTGIELVAVGSIVFGNVTIGEYRESTIRVYNHGPDPITNFNPTLVNPFSVNRITAPCNSGTIPVGVACNVVIRFTPTSKGSFTDVLTIGDKTQNTSGTGLSSAGIIDYNLSSWDLGTVVAGETTLRDIEVTNNGDFAVQSPTGSVLDGYTRTLNECGSFIAPKRTCKMRFSIVKSIVGSHSETLTMSSPDSGSYGITIISTVIPGPPSGSIVITNPPTSIIADGGIDTKTITVAPIRDQFGNIVQDGTEASLIGSNVTVQGSSTRTTVGGVVTFTITSTTQRGDATVTILSGGGSGFARFRSISGPAVGDIVAKPYIGTVEANGISQIDIRFNSLRDQFNNVVEDGTPVYFFMKQAGTNCLNFNESTTPNGNGILLSQVNNTILGEVSATITPPVLVGSSVLVVKSGTACGAYTVNYTPGLASGIIPVVSSLQGIYADPSTGITADPPEIIQTNITIGPVRDQFNNIVSQNSVVTINLQNAIGVISGTSTFTVTTDSGGFASFLIQGIGNRGYINVSAMKDTASGSNSLWAYGDAVLRPDRPNLSTNPFKLYMNYYSNANLPPLENVWGLIKNWNNLDIQDKNYFGDLKKQAPPTLVDNQLPYVVSYCLFSAGNTTYGSNCFKDNFNDNSIYQNTIKVTKGNKPADPGASLLTLALNTPRGTELHQETPVGCYKQDIQPGSATFGDLLYYPQASIDRCNSLTSTNPNSPVYNNNFSAWFEVDPVKPQPQWITNRRFNLRYSSVGFIPDLAKILVFGGFYENAMYGGGFFSPNNYEVFMSNRHTWSTNYGIDAPFNWLSQNNIEDVYGDFPEQTVMPSFANSNKDLYMFGGLFFRGNSHTNAGPMSSYIESTASETFSVFDGIVNKWFNLNPGSDPLITDENQSSSPVSRYQHGMVYVPDNDSLFMAGGKSVNLNFGFNWFEPNDMWSIKDISNRNTLQWKRRCFPCGFPTNAHNHPNNFLPSTINPTPVKMAYHPYLQKVFMVWSGTNFDVSNFNPLETTNSISINHTNNYSFSSIEGPDLYDIEVNSDIGRTYFYKRKSQGQFNSELYYWDMDPGTKQYMKIETDLGGAPAKQFIRSLGINVRGYGSILSNSQLVQGTGGITVMIYNYTTLSWDLVGDNSAAIESADVPAQSINMTYDAGQSPKYVSPTGKVNVLIFPKDLSNYSGHGYNELKIDEFYINGLF